MLSLNKAHAGDGLMEENGIRDGSPPKRFGSRTDWMGYLAAKSKYFVRINDMDNWLNFCLCSICDIRRTN